MNQKEALNRAQYLYDILEEFLPNEKLEEDEEDFSEDDYDYGYSNIFEEY